MNLLEYSCQSCGAVLASQRPIRACWACGSSDLEPTEPATPPWESQDLPDLLDGIVTLVRGAAQ